MKFKKVYVLSLILMSLLIYNLNGSENPFPHPVCLEICIDNKTELFDGLTALPTKIGVIEVEPDDVEVDLSNLVAFIKNHVGSVVHFSMNMEILPNDPVEIYQSNGNIKQDKGKMASPVSISLNDPMVVHGLTEGTVMLRCYVKTDPDNSEFQVGYISFSVKLIDNR